MLTLMLTACGSLTTGTLLTETGAPVPDSGDTAAPSTGPPEDTGTPSSDTDRPEDDAVIVDVTVPAAMTCGETADGIVTVRNVGTATWTRDAGYKLGALDDEDLLIQGDVRVWLDEADAVGPGQEHSFVLPLVAPEDWSGATTTDWQMVHEGVRWFGEETAALIDVSCEAPEEGSAPLPLPDMGHVVDQAAADRPDLLAASCVEHGGNNDFLDLVVDRLRTTDDRWGYNWKRGNEGDLSQDVVDYHFGWGSREGSEEVYIIDMIVGHCGDSPSPGWQDVTQATADAGTIGRWTGNGRF